MSTPTNRTYPTSVTREDALDDTIESSFPASDPPSSIPDPEPSPLASVADDFDFDLADDDVERPLVRNPIFWAAFGAVAISAVWLAFSWQNRRRY